MNAVFVSGILVAFAVRKEGTMADRHTIQACHWSEQTLFLSWPYWLDAERNPWSCRADGDPRLVEETQRCATCARWVSRGTATYPADRLRRD